MNKLLLSSALAALALATPMAASAQAIAPAVVAVVDVRRILEQCTACVAANAQLQSQAQQLQARGQQLATPLEAEGRALQTAVNAIPQGQQPDAALSARITAFQTAQTNAQTEIQGRQDTLQRNRQFVLQQIEPRLNAVVVQVMQQRGATIAIDRAATMAINPAVEVTDAVLALLNTQLPSVSTTAPPPPAAPAGQQPTPQPNRPRPQGR
jgi:outer membrane protein